MNQTNRMRASLNIALKLIQKRNQNIQVIPIIKLS